MRRLLPLLPRLLILLLLAWLPLRAEGERRVPCAVGPIVATGIPDDEIASACEVLGRSVRDVAGFLRLARPLAPFTTVLLPTEESMRRHFVREGIPLQSGPLPLGVTLPARRIIIVRKDHHPPREHLAETLCHEVAHVALQEGLGARLPRWLEEGVAQWVSGRRLGPDENAYLSFLARIDGLFPLEALEHRFPPAHELTSVAYQQGLLAVELLVERLGEDHFLRLLAEVARGESFLPALARLDRAPFERDLRLWVKARAGWADAFLSVLSLWTVVGVLAIAAIGRSWVRSRRAYRALPDAGEAPAPAELDLDPSSPEPDHK